LLETIAANTQTATPPSNRQTTATPPPNYRHATAYFTDRSTFAATAAAH
jgi:hypothetical protein